MSRATRGAVQANLIPALTSGTALETCLQSLCTLSADHTLNGPQPADLTPLPNCSGYGMLVSMHMH